MCVRISSAYQAYPEPCNLFARSQVGSLTTLPETCADEPTEATSGLLGAVGGFSGLVGHVSSLNISMEHVVNYGAPSGKVQCGCLLAELKMRRLCYPVA